MRSPLTHLNSLTMVFVLAAIVPLFPLSFTQPPAVAQFNQDRTVEVDLLLQRGFQQYQTSQYLAAIQSWKRALAIYRQEQNRYGEAKTLNYLGVAYWSLAEVDEAIDYYQQALVIFRQIWNRNGEAEVLGNLGLAYRFLAQYGKAIQYAQQALPIFREMQDHNNEARALNNLGIAYFSLSQFDQGILYFQQALPIYRKMQDLHGEAVALGNLGVTYLHLSRFDKAINYFQQALHINRQIKDRQGEATALMNIGIASASQAKPSGYWYEIRWGNPPKIVQSDKAIEYLLQALSIFHEIQDRHGKAKVLYSLALAYRSHSQYGRAIEYLQQALSIYREVKDSDGEGRVLSEIGSLTETQKQPELAIVFYKQSVNVWEGIRQGLRSLPRDLQKSYTQSIAGTYRRLADLLLSQGRLAEAQRVLELLKLQELKDFTRSDPGIGKQEISLLEVEKQVLQKYGTLINFGQQVYQCDLSGKSCKDLRDQLDRLTLAFNRDAKTLLKELRERLAKDPAFLAYDQLSGTATRVVNAQAGTVLIYPLVLDNKIRLLMATRATEGGVVFKTTEVSNVGQPQLWKTVSRLRELLKTPESNLQDLQQVSAQLYDWLIAPLKDELGNQQVHHLVFALDRATRYIPMGALYNRTSNQYLIQQYDISTILAAELTDTRDRLPPNSNEISVLALGVSQRAGFDPLQNVPNELKAIVRDGQNSRGIYQGKELLNEAFDYSALRDNLKHRQIVHFATHGKFEPGRPEDSYILPGKGNPLTIEEIQNLQNYMLGVHLVVLSACQTAVGGPDESGIEIPGISFYFLKNQVKAVIASLWQVNDISTSQLMTEFYRNLASGMSKAEALRQAQLFLIKAGGSATHQTRSDSFKLPANDGSQPTIVHDFSHPYYWAPFILIGNNL